jgi:p-hydroxybenzoate 3-monooxygenase
MASTWHRINLFEASGGRAVTVYAQHEVLKDLIDRRLADGGDIRFGVNDTTVDDITAERPTIRFAYEGEQQTLECDFVAGCDGSRTYTRFLMPEPAVRTDFFRQYPFAWFGILAEAPPSSDELIYAHSDRGFALISTRSPLCAASELAPHLITRAPGSAAARPTRSVPAVSARRCGVRTPT